MTILKFVHYTLRAKRASYVDSIEYVYHQQCMRDLRETLQKIQADQDRINPGKGGGVGIAANQLQYPYQPISDIDANPAPGFYPQNYVPPNIYLVHIRDERAALSQCAPCPPTFFINPILIPSGETNEATTHSGEACLSLEGFHGCNVPRYNHIYVYAQNIDGQWQSHEFTGFAARVHQHEIDFGNNIEYLLRLAFSTVEMQQITNWLADPILEENYWIVPNKLQCASSKPDIPALDQWMKAHAPTRRHSYAIDNQVIIIGADNDLGLALVRYYLRKKYRVIATHHPIQSLSPLEIYQRKYASHLTLQRLDLACGKSIEAFSANVLVNTGDIIIYNEHIHRHVGRDSQIEKIHNSSSITIYLGLFQLISTWFPQLLKNDVLWVNLSHFFSNEPSKIYTLTQALIQNIDNTFKIEWEAKTNPELRPCAISIYYEKTRTVYQLDTDTIARKIVIDCIEPVKKSKVSGVYHYDSTHQETIALREASEKSIPVATKSPPIATVPIGRNSIFPRVRPWDHHKECPENTLKVPGLT